MRERKEVAIFLRVSPLFADYMRGLEEALGVKSHRALVQLFADVFYHVLRHIMLDHKVVAVDEEGRVVDELIFKDLEVLRGQVPDVLRPFFPSVTRHNSLSQQPAHTTLWQGG